jgi:hypothetical protein
MHAAVIGIDKLSTRLSMETEVAEDDGMQRDALCAGA